MALPKAGISPGALRRLERWGFEPFSYVPDHDKVDEGIAVMANMLEPLCPREPPPPEFLECIQSAELTDAPEWFLRALLLPR